MPDANIEIQQNMEEMLNEIFHTLFPICRSITGPGIRKSLRIIAQYMPLEIKSVPSGMDVLDWTIPQEWELISARLYGPDGDIILDADDNNLHVLNFSESFQGEVTLKELQNHLYSLDELPHAIPYVTSYYSPKWGFCLSRDQRNSLKEGTYRVVIDTVKKDGVLNYGVTELPGESKETVLLTSYLCHPSMANNELSGPLGLLSVYHKLASLPKRRFTYKFLLAPETIGSITYLSQHADELSKTLYAGMVLTCLGGPNDKLNFKLSRRDWTGSPSSIDNLIRHLVKTRPERYECRDFTPISGSDERQFCSPGYNFPFVQVARTVYGRFNQYHTNLDDLEFMTIGAVEDSAHRIAAFLQTLERADHKYINQNPYGEPQLGKRNLYPNVSCRMTEDYSTDTMLDGGKFQDYLMCMLSLADGTRTLTEIAEHIGCSGVELISVVQRLEEGGLLVNR